MFLKKTNFLKVKSIFFLLMLVLSLSSSYGVENFNYFNYIEKLNSFSSSFTQYTYNDKGSLIKESNGVLLYKKKSKYILEYLSPNKIKFISDGALVTTLDIDLDQAIIQSTNNKAKNNFFEIMTNKDEITKKFILKSYLYNNDNYVKFVPKNKELENNIAGKQGGRFDYESAIAEMQGTFKAKPKENKFFFDDAPDAPDVTPLKNKLAKKAMTRGPMTAKKNQPVDLTPTTYQNFKPNYGFTKEQFEDVMRKEGVLAEDKIYGNNFYKQEIEKPIEFEQLMEVPGFKGTQNNFSEGGITGLRSKYEYKK